MFVCSFVHHFPLGSAKFLFIFTIQNIHRKKQKNCKFSPATPHRSIHTTVSSHCIVHCRRGCTVPCKQHMLQCCSSGAAHAASLILRQHLGKPCLWKYGLFQGRWWVGGGCLSINLIQTYTRCRSTFKKIPHTGDTESLNRCG